MDLSEKDILKMTKKEFQELENFYDGKPFNAFVIVPMKGKHDSGYQYMKFVLLDSFKIVGVVGGYSDVVHFDGIGGFGKNPDFKTLTLKVRDISIDCLPKSKLIRVFSIYSQMEAELPVYSDFIFYFTDLKNKKD